MTRTIYLPPGEEGEEIAKRLIPTIWEMAQGEAKKRRSKNDGG